MTMSLPGEMVDEARREREAAALGPITSNIDRLIKDGMSGIDAVAKGAAEQMAPVAQLFAGGELKLPTLDELTPEWMRPKPVQAAPVQPAQPGMQMGSVTLTDGRQQQQPSMRPGESIGNVEMANGGGSLEDWARSEARRLRIDPEIAVRVAMSEGGFSDPVRQSDVVYQGEREQSYGPYQLNVTGGLGTQAIARGIDPRKPENARAAVTYALEHAARNGWGNFHGAAQVGIGQWDGIGVDTPAPAAQGPRQTTPVEAEQTPMAQRQAGADLYPRQDQLDDPDKWAVCGPLGIMAFAAMRGTPIDYETAKEAARKAGWTPQAGMAGPQSQVAALNSIGVTAKTGAIDLETIRREVTNGNPVGLSSPGSQGHYFTVQGVDEHGRLDLGNSALSLTAARGRRWFTLDELRSLGAIGAVDTAIYMDNPASPTPSVAVSLTATPPSPSGASVAAPPPAAAGASPPPAAAPPAPWANETGGGPMMMKADESADFLPGDGGYAPQVQASPDRVAETFDPDQGAREAIPGSVGSQPLPQTPNPMTYGPIQQGDVAEGPPTLGDITYQNGGEPTGNGPWTEMPVRPLEAQQPANEQASASPGSITDHLGNVLLPVLDSAGQIVSYVQQQARQLGRQIAPRGNPVANVAQGLTPGGQTYGQAVAPIMNPRRETNVAPEAFIRDAMDVGQNAPKVPAAIDQKITEIANEARSQFQQAGQAYDEGRMGEAVLNGVMGALNVVGSPWTVAAEGIDTVLPTMEANSALSMGDAITNADLIRDARMIAQAVAKLVRAGVRVTPEIVAALRSGAAVEDFLNGAAGAIDRGIEAVAPVARRAGELASDVGAGIGRGLERAGEAFDANAARVVAADARMAETGSTATGMAVGPTPGVRGARRAPTEPWQMAPDEWQAEMARVSPDGAMPDPQVDNEAYRRWYQLNANKPAEMTPTLQTAPFETDARLRPAIESSYLRPDDYRFVSGITVSPRSSLQAENTYRARAGLQAGGVPHAKFERDGRMTFQGEILADPRVGRTMTHEVGHSIENNLPESLIERWQAEIHPASNDAFAYGRHLQNGGEAPPTPYAGQNWSEDFAESFTEWRQAQAEGRAPNLGPLRQRFMQDVDAWLSGGRSLERGTMDGQRLEQPRLLSTVGASPGGAGRDIWARAATDVGNALMGSMVGAVAPADSNEERLRNTALGATGFPLLGRGMRRAGGALGSFGPVGSRGAAEAADAGPAPTFYSQLRRTLEDKMPNRANGQQIMGILRGSAVKPDEITWTGLDDWLREQKGPVTKQQVMEFLDQNAVTVEEVVKGQPLIRWQQQGDALVAAEAPTLRVVQDADGSFRVQHDGRTSPVPFATVDEAKRAAEDIATDPKVGLIPTPAQTKYGQYTLPGGENYRELLITRPEQGQRRFRYYDPSGRPGGLVDSEEHAQEVVRMAGGRYAPEHVADPNTPSYRSSHWDEPNVLAHVRFNERTAPDGARVLLIEEVQSDWHQAGRRQGYQGPPSRSLDEIQADLNDAYRRGDNAAVERINQEAMQNERSAQGVPDAPFKKTWPELAMKRMIRWAAENGFDRIAWPPGAVHAERYSLAQSVDDVRYITKDGATGTLVAYKDGQEIVAHKGVAADKLGDYIGQDAARKLFEYEPDIRSYGDEYRLTGRDLTSVGGEGMKGFYDQILPTTAQKLGKKFGARIGMSEIDAGTGLGKDLSITRDEDGYFWFGRGGRREQGPFAERAWAEMGMEDEATRHPSRMQRVHSMDITPAMRESVVKEGQPMFSALPFDPASAAMGGAAGAASEDEEGEPNTGAALGGAAVAGVLNFRRLPGVQRAINASQRRAAQMAVRGQQPLNPLQWLRKFAGNVGYSSMIGIQTASVNFAGNLFEPPYATLKETTRAVLPRRMGGRGAPAEARAAFMGGLHGLTQTGREMWDAVRARGNYASNPDQPSLSEQTINPLGHALALGTEVGGRIFSGVPDAFFGTIARHAGEAREAAQVATDAIRGGTLAKADWQKAVDMLLQDANAIRNGQPPQMGAISQQVVDAGKKYADDQTFRSELGTIGKKGEEWARLMNMPVLGNLVTPFYTTPWNMNLRRLERTPVVGAVMNTQRGFDKAYDQIAGTALLAGGVSYAMHGRITGSGPDDPEKRKMMEQEGWRPNSTLVPWTDGKQYYVPNRVFGIYGTALNTIGEVHDAIAYQKPNGSIVQDAQKRFGKIVKQEPYLQGVANIITALTDPQGGGLNQYIASNVTRLVPYASTARAVSGSQDTVERDLERQREMPMEQDVLQRIRSGLGMRSEMPAKTDIKGQEIPNQQPGAWALLPKITLAKEDPAISHLLENDADLTQPRRYWTATVAGAASPDGARGAVQVDMPHQQQVDWQRYRWENLQMRLDALQAIPEYGQLNAAQKKQRLQQAVERANDYATRMTRSDLGPEEFNRLLEEAVRTQRKAS